MKYYNEINNLIEEMYETLKKYPITKENIDKIFEDDLVDIQKLIDTNDEYYLKKAITKLKDLIENIKEINYYTEKYYNELDSLINKWKKIKLNVSKEEIDIINKNIKKCNELLDTGEINDVIEIIKILNKLIKKYDK